MDNTLKQLQKIRVDAVYGKKKHFNAATRKRFYHSCIGVGIIVINVLIGSSLFFLLSKTIPEEAKWVGAGLACIAAVFAAIQTFFGFQRTIAGHNTVATQYLSVAKESNRVIAYYRDNLRTGDQIVSEIERLSREIELINSRSLPFPTSNADFELARVGIKDGEENYTDEELELL